MTPSGVEQIIGATSALGGVWVPSTMTPSGVEQLALIQDWTWAHSRAFDDDAFGR